MSCIAFLLAGGVCERFPEAKFIFLEANGGWLVPWLERLDHHCRKFQWEVPNLSMLPSEYMKRQCWISFDPDEAMLRITAESPLVGADRIIWASDYPASRRQVPRRDRGAGRGARRLDLRAEADDHLGERHRALRHRLIAGTGTQPNPPQGRNDEAGPGNRPGLFLCPQWDRPDYALPPTS